MSIDNLHVIILGAGTTGLLIAQGLKKNGINFSIFEREDEDKYKNHARDWSMAVFWAADYIKNTLPQNLRDRFDEIRSDPHDNPGPDRKGWLPLYNGKTAELVVKIPGGEATRVSKEKLRKVFSEDLDINFGKESAKIEEKGDSIKVTFQDGSVATGSTVVCCDGIKGIGRTLLLGEEQAVLSTAPSTLVNVSHKYTAEQARFIRDSLDPVIKMSIHPDQPTVFLITSVDVPDLAKPEDWRIQLLMSTWGATHSESSAERLRIFKEAASSYAEPWRSAASWLPDDMYIPDDYIRYWAEPVAWPNWNGKVTLAGDAAHPMMPFRAQGLNNALQDAHNYVASLVAVREDKTSLPDAIAQYGAEVLERGGAEIKLSSAWGPALHDWNTLMNFPMMKQGYGKKTQSEKKEDELDRELPAAADGSTTAQIEPPAAIEAEVKDPVEPKALVGDNAVGSRTLTPEEEPCYLATKPSSISNEIGLSDQSPPTTSSKPGSITTTTNQNGLPTPSTNSPTDPLNKADQVTAINSALLEQEFSSLRSEIEKLEKRNYLLEEKLKAIASLVVNHD